MARKSLTDNGVAALKPRHKAYAYPDPELAGHYVRVQPSGAASFVCVARNPDGKQIWTTLGATDAMQIDDARERAREALQRVRDGLPAIPPRSETFRQVAENWIKRHAEAKGVRTVPQIKRLLNVHVYPTWGERPFLELRRSDVASLLDELEDDHGARQADMVLTVVRSIMNWFATRNDDYVVPVVRGMKRQDEKARARSRILDDDEIRAIWKAAESNGTFGAFLRVCLLTAQRRTKVAAMKWEDVTANGIWVIPQGHREKGNAEALKLPKLALEIIRNQPELASNPHVFAGRRDGPISGFSVLKAAFDRKVPIATRWTIHDLRRTARSLLSRAGVFSEHAERVMGHAIPGVEGTYDRHTYDQEKAVALEKLARLIERIAHPKDNVLPMTKVGSV